MSNNTAESQARAQVRGITEMVSALQCDFNRLKALRDERDDLKSDMESEMDGREGDYPDGHPAIAARDALEEWEMENAEELAELEKAAGDYENEDEARERISEDPLSVEVRSDWCSPGEEMTAGEFRIVLCTGGPHVELVGDLDEHSEPSRVRVLYRDWGDSGELFDFDREPLLTYCRCHYFGG